MSNQVRLLLIEDNPDDVELELAALREEGLVVAYEVVETAADLRAALASERWDIIISDYSMPQLNGLAALRIARELCPEIPFILVSGTVGEDVAVEAMRAGAQDYILKQNLTRLASAVERELREAKVRESGLVLQKGLRLMADVGAALGAPLDREANLTEVAQVIARSDFGELSAIALSDADGTPYWTAHAHTDAARALLWRGLASENPPRQVAPTSAGSAAHHEAPAHERDAADVGEPFARIADALGLRSTVSVPLVVASAPIGTLHVARQRAYSSTERRVFEELSNQVAVAIENSRLYRRAQAAVALRDEFLAIASHELRTPLTALQLNLQSLRAVTGRERAQPADERHAERIERCLRSVAVLEKLVDSLLDVSRIASGVVSLERETFDLVELVREVAEGFRGAAARAGVALSILPSAPVVGSWDRHGLEQVVSSLLANAVKYGDGKPVEIEVGEVEGSARVVVVDHGIGIPPADLERVFGRFERAVSSRHYGGLGLGLFVTRHFVEAHGGTVSVGLTDGGGATFTVTLPRSPSRGEEGPDER